MYGLQAGGVSPYQMLVNVQIQAHCRMCSERSPMIEGFVLLHMHAHRFPARVSESAVTHKRANKSDTFCFPCMVMILLCSCTLELLLIASA